MSGQSAVQSVLKTRSARQSSPGGAHLVIRGKFFIADVSGALYWPAEQTLIIADLTLDREPRIERLFPQEDEGYFFDENVGRCEALVRLSSVVATYDPRHIIILGAPVSYENADCELVSQDIIDLQKLRRQCSISWIFEGPKPGGLGFLDIHIQKTLSLGGLIFRPSPLRASAVHEIAGGMYPMARINQDEKIASPRCFVSDSQRLIMPSFSLFNPLCNVLGQAFDPLFSQTARYVWMIGFNSVHSVSSRLLLEDEAVERLYKNNMYQ